jgi:integrase
MLTLEIKTGKEAWLSGFSISSVRVYNAGYELFIKFMDETEEGIWTEERLIREREEDVKKRSYAFEHKLVEFYSWLKENHPNFSDWTRKSYLKAIRSFFAFHRLDVKFTQQQKSKVGKKPKPKTQYYEYTLEDIKKMASVSKPKERYILLAGKELGLRASDFVKLKQGTFEAHDLDEEVPVSLGEIYTVKEGVNAKPFLGFDGREVVKQWLTVLKSQGRYDPNKPMLEISKSELSEILKRLTKRARINTGNEKIRFHQLRVFLVTRLAQIMETNHWKQIIGKEIDERSYVRPFQLREDYRKVLPLISVNPSVSITRREDLEKLNRRILDVETENIVLRKKIETLKARMKNNFEDMKQILEVQQKTIELLSEGLGKAKHKA